jgi:hypothetical protein
MLRIQIAVLMRSHNELFQIGLAMWGFFLILASYTLVTGFFEVKDLPPPEEKTTWMSSARRLLAAVFGAAFALAGSLYSLMAGVWFRRVYLVVAIALAALVTLIVFVMNRELKELPVKFVRPPGLPPA